MRVVVTDRKYPGEDNFSDVVEAAGGEIVYGDFGTAAETVEGCRGADVVVSARRAITREVVGAMGGGELIFKLTTGYDNVAVNAATRAGIPVANAPAYCTPEVAEHAIALLLAVSRQVPAHDRRVRAGEGWGSRGGLRSTLGDTFGVVGFGRIGRAAARLAAGLGMEVVACDPYVPADVFRMAGVRREDLAGVLAEADCVSLHAALTEETRGLLGAEAFAAMKPSAVVVNTARGPMVDVGALVEAVEGGEIWGAGLDVFETEPPADPGVLESDRIVRSPHHAGRTPRGKERLLRYAREKLGRVVRGGHHGEIVNPELYNLAPDG